MVGEDVEDDRGPVDDRNAGLLLQVALLARQELVVDCDQVRAGLLDDPLQLAELALAEVAIGVGARAPLDQLAGVGDARGAKELAQLGQVRLERRNGHAQGTLTRAGIDDALAIRRLRDSAVAATIHRPQG